MSASLVGSEMCIRDRPKAAPLEAQRPPLPAATRRKFRQARRKAPGPVSYTHLTLPTDMQCVDLG
eukprot:8433426-Alexandrium_andersonii.AAC.1